METYQIILFAVLVFTPIIWMCWKFINKHDRQAQADSFREFSDYGTKAINKNIKSYL
jgi:hypothetical protein